MLDFNKEKIPMGFQNRDFLYPSALESFMRRVYQWMTAGLAITGFAAMGVASNPALLRLIFATPLFWILAIVEIGIVFWLSRAIQKGISPQAAIAGFLVYSALNGLTLSVIFVAYTGASVATTFFIAAGSFAGMSLYGWTTKHDLSGIGSYFIMGLIGVLIASVVNLFLGSTVLEWIVSYAGVFVFLGLTVYDTHKLKQIHDSQPNASEQTAIMGALALYLDFINLFLFLLRIFGRRRD